MREVWCFAQCDDNKLFILKFVNHLLNAGIIIRFLGEANTEWTEERNVTTSEGKTENEITHLKGHEEYFKIQYYLLGGKNSKLCSYNLTVI